MPIGEIVTKTLANYDSQNSIASKLRAKRITPLLEMIEEVFSIYGHVNIIDVGGTETYWNIISRPYLNDHNVSITIVNLPGTVAAENHGPFKFVTADGCDLSGFSDQSFHIAHSNSVIEHVGRWQQMVQFAKELSRVSSKSFVQTPNYWFPIEPHCMTPFFHWLPKPLQMWLVSRFQLGNWGRADTIQEEMRLVEHANLLTKHMLQALFKDAEIAIEWFLIFPKSLIAVRR